MLRLDPDEKSKLKEQGSILPISTLTTPETILEIHNKAYVDSLHDENEQSRRDLRFDFYDESNELVKGNQNDNFNDNKLTNIDSIKFNRKPILDDEVSVKTYIDDELDKSTILRFNQALENYLKVSVGNDVYNLAKYDKIQITNTTIIETPNTGGYHIENSYINCNDKMKMTKYKLL